MEEGEQLRQSEHALLRLAGEARSKVQSHHALRHIKDGFMHRLLISQEARLEMDAALESQGESRLEGNQTVRLSLFLGAFYLNLIGALDNLAWTLQYEFELFDGVQEEEPGRRNSIGLFKPGFLEKLGALNPDLASGLRRHKPWFLEVTSIRDPAAHRIPPGFMTGQIAPDDIPEFERLMAEAKQSFADAEQMDRTSEEGDEFDFDAMMAEHKRFMNLIMRGYELRHEAESLSTFSPLIVKFSPDGHEIAWAPSLLARDQNRFIGASTLVLSALVHQNT
ncbi:hypothetical protein [Rubrivirga sp.]|uniref:hypothetical protein n=1 Tax=Rubrivirga sp. TaxID=1885344 RepID=UPI003B5302E2